MNLPTSQIDPIRIHADDDREPSSRGGFVCYWMTAFRRLQDNFALQRAVEWSNFLEKPLLIIESLRLDYPWASRRFHQFVYDGIRSKMKQFSRGKAIYRPFVEKRSKEEISRLQNLADEMAVLITDDFPARFHTDRIKQVSDRVDCRLEMVDSNGLMPLRSAAQIYQRAFTFRNFLKKNLPEYLHDFPLEEPLENLKHGLSSELEKRIRKVIGPDELPAFSELSIDQSVEPVAGTTGGTEPAWERLISFIDQKRAHYAEFRNHPEKDYTSGLSPYLHSGHISSHTIFRELAKQEDWSPEKVQSESKSKEWLGFSPDTESFLDELVTWREIGYNMACQDPQYDRYETLPEWARKTLREHESDEREYLYKVSEFEESRTHDPLWNAAQNQLKSEGKIHNYLRMLWGKKILEWSSSPREALDTMVHLNNKYALDGRNPNSYSGIFWILGRYDRPWGPERPVFGKIRYMSSANTARKFKVGNYIEKYNSDRLF